MGIRIVSRGFAEERLRRSIFRILRESVLCSVATVNPAKRAHINTAYFCYSNDLELYFLSDPNSTHSRNLSANSSMAMTVFRSSQRWGGSDSGLQLFGTVDEARGRWAEKAEKLYRRRFRLYAKWMAGRSGDDKRRASRLRSYRFYRFLPNKVKILDEADYGGAAFITAMVRRRNGSS